MSDKSTQTSGIGFTSLLTILFIGLKLTGYIDWSWWWVLSPTWISFAFFVLILIIIIGILVWTDIQDNKRRSRRGW